MNVVNLLVKEEEFTEQANHFHVENQRVSLTFGTLLSILKAISKKKRAYRRSGFRMNAVVHNLTF
jgi:hypothetical protein